MSRGTFDAARRGASGARRKSEAIRRMLVAVKLDGAYGRAMRNKLILLTALVAVAALPLPGDEPEYAKIRGGLQKLAPLVGSWKTVFSFYDKDGVTEEVGTTQVSYVLDETYLQLLVDRHNRKDPRRRRQMI